MTHDSTYAVPYRTKSGKEQWKPTLETIQMCDDSNCGFCLACGDSDTPAEPDAVRYTCEACGAPKVYGAQELAIMGLAA